MLWSQYITKTSLPSVNNFFNGNDDQKNNNNNNKNNNNNSKCLICSKLHSIG